MKYINKVLLLFPTLIIAASCATVPITGRKQVNFLPEAKMSQIGFQKYGEFLETNPISNNRDAAALVTKVGMKPVLPL